MKKQLAIIIAGAGIFVLILLTVLLADALVALLWMYHIGFVSVFWKILSCKAALFLSAFAGVFFFILINLEAALKNSLRVSDGEPLTFTLENKNSVTLTRGKAHALIIILSGLPAFLFGQIFMTFWDRLIRFYNGGAFGTVDPVYGNDIGFYLFRLPFYELLQNSVAALIIVTVVLTLIVYAALSPPRREVYPSMLLKLTGSYHIGLLLAALAAAWGWGYYLDRFGLLFSPEGAVYGAGYTDAVAVRASLWIMVTASLGLAACLLISLAVKRMIPAYAGIVVYILTLIVALFLIPSFIQSFIVNPNELECETPYLKHNISFTRKAYLLDTVKERQYPGESAPLTKEDIRQNRETLENIRLWDWRPIRQTFRQTQEIRLYYKFYEVDVDRYRLGGDYGYRQVMISARELAPDLPAAAQTWVNRYLQFTHGYGIAMSLVSQTVEEGLPQYIVQDLPPRSDAPQISVDRAAIYYGEMMSGYRIVQTGVKEFDYPKGDDNVYTSYGGSGGVPVNALWKRLLFAWSFSDVNILLTRYITPDSRIQYWRKIQERIGTIAPFLQLDRDPYMIVSGGKLYWIQDAYTVSSRYPYAEPYSTGLNYIRNSVKIVVDAYNGSVTFYAVNPDEPVLKAYRNAFPGLFTSADKMPTGIKKHIRYPQDLFSIQVAMYNTYHMTVPQVFYNREDLWTLPQEKYAGSPVPVEPYYILMKLPEETDLQYIIMTPLTPDNRDNMIAWMAAKCDFPDYGSVVLYKLPKERLIYGPMQIEAMIDQDDKISQKLSLWDQRGSKVIRGNLLVIPLGHSFIYVEPVYLIAEQTDIPQLKRVITVYGKQVVMRRTRSEAIEALLGKPESTKQTGPAPVKPALLSEAQKQLEQAELSLREGNWEKFGRQMSKLKRQLESPVTPEP